MATFGDVLSQFQNEQRNSPADRVRRAYLKTLHDLTGRNVVVYYSGWLQKQEPSYFGITQINDEDKHGFMAAFAGLDFSKGLDLILHTPGGDVAATESIIDYIRSKFGQDIRVIVPQISMSGGTMIALAGKEIVMGLHSNLGPIDPQIGGKPAIAILKEFDTARDEIVADPKKAFLWQPILQQYPPTLLSLANHSIKWAREIGKKTLLEGMLLGDPNGDAVADQAVDFLLSHDLHKAHGRHLHRTELQAQGLKIVSLEADSALQDAVLSVHHACMLTVGNFGVAKLIENQNGITHAKIVGTVQIPIQQVAQPAPVPAAPGSAPKLSFGQRLKIAIALLFNRQSVSV